MGDDGVGVAVAHAVLRLRQRDQLHVFCRAGRADQRFPVGNRNVGTSATFFLDSPQLIPVGDPKFALSGRSHMCSQVPGL